MNSFITPRIATIDFGPVQLQGYMMPDLSFRQSQSSTAKALGINSGTLSYYIPKALNFINSEKASVDENPSNAVVLADSTPKSSVVAETAQILEIPTGMGGFSSTAVDRDWETRSLS